MCDTTGVTSISLCNPDLSPISSQEDPTPHIRHGQHHSSKSSKHGHNEGQNGKQNQVGSAMLFGVSIVSLVMDGKERLCLAQISSTLLKEFSYNEIHNRRVALGITCVQCTPVQLEILRRAGAMPVTSRRCGMITKREAERLCQSFLGDHAPPQLPENFAFEVYHECGWGGRGSFVPSRYNSSRAKCIRCAYCQLFFSPNKFIFHSHRLPESRYVQPDAANFNSWRRHLKLCGDPPEEENSISPKSLGTAQIVHAWEDVRAMFNGGTRKRMLAAHSSPSSSQSGLGHQRSDHGQGQRQSSSNLSCPNQRSRTSKSSSSNNPISSKQTPTTSPPPRHGIPISPLVPALFSPQHASGPHQSPVNTNNGSTSPHPFFPPNPLLSPTSRLDIWNPGISSLASNRVPSGPLPQMPFHPLSFPWLRRPLFPFPHPFSPAACHLLADAGISMPEKLAIVSSLPTGAGRQSNQSAFKPVSTSRSDNNLFSWLHTGNGTNLPEDLSTNSQNSGNDNNPHSTITSPTRSPVSSTNDDSTHSNTHYNGRHLHHQQLQPKPRRRSGSSSGTKHQIQIVSNPSQNDSEDEENVDIESTEVDDECSSTSLIWVNNNNNNNNTKVVVNEGRRKLVVESHFAGCSSSSSESVSGSGSSGEDEKCESESFPSKRKRLWDFDRSKNVQKNELRSNYCEET